MSRLTLGRCLDRPRWAQPAGLAAFARRPRPRQVEAAGSSSSGQKQGRVKAAQERLKSLEPSSRKAYGQKFNAVKTELEAASRPPGPRVERKDEGRGRDRRDAAGHPAPARPSPSPDPDRRRADRPVRPIRVRRGPRPRGRGRPPQLRRPQHPAQPSGPRPAGQLLPGGRRAVRRDRSAGQRCGRCSAARRAPCRSA